MDDVNAKQSVPPETFRYDEDFVYDSVGAPAQNVKAIAQMVVGAVLFFLLLLHAGETVAAHIGAIATLQNVDVLKLVSYGLMYAAGIELCFMLYTKGPDEAVAPVILSIAGAI